MTAREFTKDPVFRAACELGKVQPSVRQARKWMRRDGTAYQHRAEAVKLVHGEGA